MPAFTFTAINKEGKVSQGVREGESSRAVRQDLRDEGLYPTDVNIALPSSMQAKRFSFSFSRKKMPVKTLSLFTRQFATLIKSGLPVESALGACAEQTDHQGAKTILLSVRSSVREGKSLASSFKGESGVFSSLYCAQVAAGETSGHLPDILERLADFVESRQDMRQRILAALAYPALMLIVSLAILAFLLTYVVPSILDVFTNTGKALPVVTKILLSMSTGISMYGVYGIIGVALFVSVFRYLLNSQSSFRSSMHRIMLRVPGLSRMIRLINTGRFLKIFSVLLYAGTPVLDAMRSSSALVTSIPIKQSLKIATDHVREGAAIHLALKNTQFFEPMSVHLIASGETSGSLYEMVDGAANNLENEVSRFIDTFLTLFEPMTILVMGGLVLFIVLAIMLPIFSMNDLIN